MDARHAAQDPRRTSAEGARDSALDHFKLGHWLQWSPNHLLKALDHPPSIVSTSKGHEERTHIASLRATTTAIELTPSPAK